MEELTSILGIVVAAGILLAKLFIREKANGKANPGGEAWPAQQRPATNRPKKERDTTPTMIRQVTTVPEDNRENRRTKKKAADAIHATEIRSADAPKELRPKAPESPTTEFDLQRAIVYSEILKPKFDE